MTETRKRSRFGDVMPVIAALLLTGIAVERTVCRTAPADADSYHAAIRQSAARMPTSVGPWLAVDVPLPPAAATLLKPNVLVSRRFGHMHSGRSFQFLLVQCQDARDMLGHFPPACYPAQGWRQESAQPADWEIDGWKVAGMTYTFSSARHEMPVRLVVENFMILPDGTFRREMDDVELVARQRSRRFFGAAQVQLVFDADFTAAERADLVGMLVRANRETMDAIRQGS